jgi:hypothetical protein
MYVVYVRGVPVYRCEIYFMRMQAKQVISVLKERCAKWSDHHAPRVGGLSPSFTLPRDAKTIAVNGSVPDYSRQTATTHLRCARREHLTCSGTLVSHSPGTMSFTNDTAHYQPDRHLGEPQPKIELRREKAGDQLGATRSSFHAGSLGLAVRIIESRRLRRLGEQHQIATRSAWKGATLLQLTDCEEGSC